MSVYSNDKDVNECLMSIMSKVLERVSERADQAERLKWCGYDKENGISRKAHVEKCPSI
jgi:hypothetical protein